MKTMNQVQQVIDRIGQLKARRDQLDTAIEDLQNQIKFLGKGTYAGTKFIGIVKSYERSSTAWKAIAEELGASKELIEFHTKKTGVVSYESQAIANA